MTSRSVTRAQVDGRNERTEATFHAILLALSGAHVPDRTVGMLADLGGPLDADIIVLHVRECLLGAGGEWILGTNGPFDEGRETAAHILERVVSPLRSRGIRARGVAVAGRPGQVARIVVDAAVAEHAGLIVVGFHPRSLVGELVAGGKARKIQRLSPVPVLTLRTRRRETRTV